jgi:hypothetical protein
MVPIRAAVLTLFALAGGRALAEPVPLSPSEQAREERAFGAVQKATRTFQADIRQAVLIRPLFHTIISVGTIAYQAPDRLTVRFSQPAGQFLRIDKGTVTLAKPGESPRRVSLDSPSGLNASALLDFFRIGGADWGRDFTVSMTRDGNLLFVSLVPLPGSPKEGHAEEIVTTLHLPDHEVKAMRISVNPFVRIDYQFSHNRRNGSLDPALLVP